MNEEENPRDGARGEAGNSISNDGSTDADADIGTDTDGTPSNDVPGGDGSADGSTVKDGVPPEDVDIQTSIGPDADAPDASDEDLDQYKDPDAGLDKVVLDDDEGPKGLSDDLLAGEPTFGNKEALRPPYTPHGLPHRTDQIGQMATILVSAPRGETPSNILIYRKTGTGKTASTKFVSQELESTSQEYDVPCEVEYISYEMTDTQYRVLAQLTSKFIEENVERIEAEQEYLGEMRTRATEDLNALEETSYDSTTGIDERAAESNDDTDEMETVPMIKQSTDRIYAMFFDAVDYREQVVVVMLNRINKLVKKSGGDTLYNLPRMNFELDNSRIPTMGISNNLKLTGFLDPRIRSGLSEEKVIFSPYGANQFHDILQHRADMAFKPGVLTDDVVPLCVAFVVQEHGDARCALDLLRTAGELAECGQASTVEGTHVRQTQDKIELDRVVEVVHTLPTQSKIVLFAIILLGKDGVHSIGTGEVFNIYKRLCKEIDVDILTQHRVIDLAPELDMFGTVSVVVVSKGYYGRTRETNLPVPIGEIEATLLTGS